MVLYKRAKLAAPIYVHNNEPKQYRYYSYANAIRYYSYANAIRIRVLITM